MSASRNDLESLIHPLVRESVFKAFQKVDRKLFVPDEYTNFAYLDTPIPLNKNSSISQPLLVAKMTNLLDLNPGDRVLEIGTASGFSAAILSVLAENVDTIEVDEELAMGAKERLTKLGFDNITVHSGDGSQGIPSLAPFDAISVTASAEEIPQALLDQLTEGGRLIIPSGQQDDWQTLYRITKDGDNFSEQTFGKVRFVPLVTVSSAKDGE